MFAPADRASTYAALQRARAGALEAERLAADTSSWWASVVGAESSAAALRSNASAARSLADALEGRWDRLDSRATYATPDEVADFLRAAGASGNVAAREAADLLSPGGAVREVGGGIARDVADVAGDALGASANVGAGLLALLRVSPYLLAGLAALVLWSWGRKARTRLGV